MIDDHVPSRAGHRLPVTSACCAQKAAVRFRSRAPIPLAPPEIDPNFLSDEADLEGWSPGFKTHQTAVGYAAGAQALQKPPTCSPQA